MFKSAGDKLTPCTRHGVLGEGTIWRANSLPHNMATLTDFLALTPEVAASHMHLLPTPVSHKTSLFPITRLLANMLLIFASLHVGPRTILKKSVISLFFLSLCKF